MCWSSFLFHFNIQILSHQLWDQQFSLEYYRLFESLNPNKNSIEILTKSKGKEIFVLRQLSSCNTVDLRSVRIPYHVEYSKKKRREIFDRISKLDDNVHDVKWNKSMGQFYKKCPSKCKSNFEFVFSSFFFDRILTMVTCVTIASTTSCLNGRKTMAWYLTGNIT